MEVFDPIKQLQALLDDRSKVLEKISGIHSALDSIKSAGASLAQARSQAEAMTAVGSSALPNAENPLYERLVNTLRMMQMQIEERVRPLAQESVQTEATRLRHQCEQEQSALTECLTRIDQCIATCTDRINDYQKTYAELARLNQRLMALGAEPEPLPESFTTEQFTATISARLGKIPLQAKF